MPSSGAKRTANRRCANACSACKRRKERCDGRQPCSRCITRDVPHACSFLHPPRRQPPAPLITAIGGQSRQSPPRSPHLQAYASSSPASSNQATPARQQHHSIDIGRPRPDSAGGTVSSQTQQDDTIATSMGQAQGQQNHRPSHRRVSGPSSGSVPDPISLAPVPHLSRLIQADRGQSLFFVGDSANLCFLQTIRSLVRESLGTCPFTDDPVQHVFVEAAPSSDSQEHWVTSTLGRPPPTTSSSEAANFLGWFLRSTNALLGLFDSADLKENMSQWLERQSQPLPSQLNGTTTSAAMQSSIFFLILAIGAQTDPGEDDDSRAEKYFNYGRYLTLSDAALDPSVPTIQAYILMTVYLLGASRRNGAFMCLGTAVRAAYALGIYRSDVNAVFEPGGYVPRERLWRALRTLDIFLSTSMGRPLATAETRDTKSEANYSTVVDLCSIFETILTEVYSARAVSTATIEDVSQRHRLWTSRFAFGLNADGIPTEDEYVETDGIKTSNIGLFNLKGAYYWTIMLLLRPFLVERVSQHIAQAHTHTAQIPSDGPETTPSHADDIVAYACIDAAMRTLSMHQRLLSAARVPRRLLFVVNHIFVSALGLGLAQFGDFDRTFAIGKSLALSQQLLTHFGRHDAVAKRYAAIVGDLQGACDLYVERRARDRMERHSALISNIFGSVDDCTKNKTEMGKLPAGSFSAGTGTVPRSAATRSGGDFHQGNCPTDHQSLRPRAEMGMGLTPPPAEADVDYLGMDPDVNDNTVISSYSSIGMMQQQEGQHMSLGGQLQQNMSFGMEGDESAQFPPTGLSDMFLSMSPRVLSFDSFDRSLPLFSMTDSAMI